MNFHKNMKFLKIREMIHFCLFSFQGCQYRDHVTDPKTPTELDIFRIWNDHKELIKADPPPLVPPERMRLVSSSREESGDKKSPCKDPLWWDGLELIPPKPKLGLLAKIWDHVMKKEDPKSKIFVSRKFECQSRLLQVSLVFRGGFVFGRIRK